jgi:hypothetical protein
MNAYRVLMRKRLEKYPLISPTRRCEDNIKIDLMKTGYEGERLVDGADCVQRC